MREWRITCDHCGVEISGNPFAVSIERVGREEDASTINQEEAFVLDLCEACVDELRSWKMVRTNTGILPVLIIGRSGTGKSTSLRNCVDNPDWNLIRVLNKPLPFKGKINGWNTDNYQQVMKCLIASKANNIVMHWKSASGFYMISLDLVRSASIG